MTILRYCIAILIFLGTGATGQAQDRILPDQLNEIIFVMITFLHWTNGRNVRICGRMGEDTNDFHSPVESV